MAGGTGFSSRMLPGACVDQVPVRVAADLYSYPEEAVPNAYGLLAGGGIARRSESLGSGLARHGYLSTIFTALERKRSGGPNLSECYAELARTRRGLDGSTGSKAWPGPDYFRPFASVSGLGSG